MMWVETETEKIVAVLHDVVEDSQPPAALGVRRTAARGLFRARAGGAGRCDAERGRDLRGIIRRSLTYPVARRVKLADLEDNLDLRRLATLTDRDAERLRRYLAAWRVLTGAE